MTIKEQLKELKEIDKDIDCLQQQLDLEKAKIATVDYTKDRVQSSNYEDVYDRIDDYNDRIVAKIDLLISKKQDLRKFVDSTLTGPHWQVINYYYFCNGYTWEKIAVDLNYSYQHVHYLHGRALQKLSEHF